AADPGARKERDRLGLPQLTPTPRLDQRLKRLGHSAGIPAGFLYCSGRRNETSGRARCDCDCLDSVDTEIELFMKLPEPTACLDPKGSRWAGGSFVNNSICGGDWGAQERKHDRAQGKSPRSETAAEV